jgi:hypothetical protein
MQDDASPSPSPPRQGGKGGARRRLLSFLPAAAALAVFLLTAGDSVRRAAADDFADYDMYWFAAAASESPPGTDVYEAAGEIATNRMRQRYMGVLDPSSPHGLAPEYYVANSSTPFLFAALSRLSLHDLRADFVLYQAVSTLCFLYALLSVLRWWRVGPVLSLSVLVAATTLFSPYLSDYGNASLTRILLGFLALSVPLLARGTRGASLGGGALLAVASLLKPIVLLAPPFLFLWRIRRREFGRVAREAAGFGAAAAAGALFAAAHFRSPGIWSSWAGRLAALPRSALPVTSGNFSLTDLLIWTTGRDLSSVLPVATGAILAGAFLLVTVRAGGSAGEGAGEDPDTERRRCSLLLSLGCVAFLVASPRAWTHYYLLALPLLVALPCGRSAGGRGDRARAGLALLSAAMCSVVTVTLHVTALMVNEIIVVLGIVTWCGALLAYATGLWALAAGAFAAARGGEGAG